MKLQTFPVLPPVTFYYCLAKPNVLWRFLHFLDCTSPSQEVSPSPFLLWQHTVRAHSTCGSRGSISIQTQTPKPCLSCAVGIPWPHPVLQDTGSFTVSPGWALVPSVAPDWNPGWTPNLISHFALPGAADETLVPSASLPIQLRHCRTVPGWWGHCLGWGPCQFPASQCSSIPAAPWNQQPRQLDRDLLLSETAINTHGIFTLVAVEIIAATAVRFGKGLPSKTDVVGAWKRAELQRNYYWKQGMRRTA